MATDARREPASAAGQRVRFCLAAVLLVTSLLVALTGVTGGGVPAALTAARGTSVGGAGMRGETEGIGSEWSVLDSFGEAPINFDSIACAGGTSTCFAAGYGSTAEIYESTNEGASWSLSASLGDVNGIFSSIACPSVTTCYAAGYTVPGFVYGTTDGGAHWSNETLTSDPSLVGQITGISCPSTTTCYAIGDYDGGDGFYVTTDGGASWSAQELEAGTHLVVRGLACPQAGTCYLSFMLESSVLSGAFILDTENGGQTWSPLYAIIDSTYAGQVACSSVYDCVVAGETVQGDGGIWTMTATVAGVVSTAESFVQSSGGAINGLSCFVTACLGVGVEQAPNGLYVAQAYFTGGDNFWYTWAAPWVEAPGFNGVACVSFSECLIGTSGSTGATGTVYSLDSLVGTFTEGQFPTWASQLDAITCPTSTTCYIAGTSTTDATDGPGSGTSFNLAEDLTTTDGGAQWSPQYVDQDSALAITCTSTTSCVSVGDGIVSNDSVLVTSNEGASWSAAPAQPTQATLTGVACAPTTTTCLAVGDFLSNYYEGAISTDAGQHWSILSALTTQGLLAISCPTATDCYAVGGDGGTAVAEATTNGGKTWTAQQLPSGIAQLASIACWSATGCVAVGTTGQAAAVALATSNGGSTWTPGNLPEGGSSLQSVTCPESGTCVAVGSQDSSGRAVAGVAYASDNGGETWSAQSVPSAVESLEGISCAGASCYTVGYESGFPNPGVPGGVVLSLGRGPLPQNETCDLGGGDASVDPGCANVVATAGATINTADGDYYASATDESVATYGTPLDFVRTYDALAAQQETETSSPGPLGYGWTDNWSTRLVPPPGSASLSASQPVVLVEPSGGEETFSPPSASSGSCPAGENLNGADYCTVPNVLATLTYSSSTDEYTLLERGGTEDIFDSNGRLSTVVDPAGDTTNLLYGDPSPGDPGCPSTAVSCLTVQSASGRTLTIGWSAAGETGQITSVSDPMGRTWTYSYSNGDLVSATDPLDDVTSYGYDTGNSDPDLVGDLTTITAPNGQPGGPDAGTELVSTYDASGRVVTQTTPAGNETTIDYSDLSDGSGAVVVTSPDGFATTETYGSGQLVEKQLPNGTTTSYSYDDTPTGNGGVFTLLTTGVTVKDTTATHTSSATYDSQGDLTSFTDARNNTTNASFDTYDDLDVMTCSSTAEATSRCGPSSSTPPPLPFGTISLLTPAGAPPDGDTYYSYDRDGNLLATATGIYDDAVSKVQATGIQATYSLYGNLEQWNMLTLPSGKVVECSPAPPSPSLPCASVRDTGSPAPGASSYVVTVDSYSAPAQSDGVVTSYPGDLIASEVLDTDAVLAVTGDVYSETTYTYDLDGEQTSVTDPDAYASGSAGITAYTTTTTYTADGQVRTVTDGGGAGSGVVPRVTTYGYDANGNTTSVSRAASIELVGASNAQASTALPRGGTGSAVQLQLPSAAGAGDEAVLAVTVSLRARARSSTACPSQSPGAAPPGPTHPGAIPAPTPPTVPSAFKEVACVDSGRTSTSVYDAPVAALASTLTVSDAALGAALSAGLAVYSNVDTSGPIDGSPATSGDDAALSLTTSGTGDELVDVLGIGQLTRLPSFAGGGGLRLSPSGNSADFAVPSVSAIDARSSQLLADDPAPVIAGALPSRYVWSLHDASSSAQLTEVLLALSPEPGAASTSSIAYDADNEPVLTTNPFGESTLTCYDGDGNAVESVPPEGVAASKLGEASCSRSNLYLSGYLSGTSETLPVALATDATLASYDGQGDETELQTPLPNGASAAPQTTYGYDGFGELTSVDAPGQTTTYGYNPDGQVTSVTVGQGSSASTTTYCYDDDGNETESIPGDSPSTQCSAASISMSGCEPGDPSTWAVPSAPWYQTSYLYDSVGELIEQIGPATGASTTKEELPSCTWYAYNDDSTLSSTTSTRFTPSASGPAQLSNDTTDYGDYNPLGEVGSVSYPTSSNSGPTATFIYYPDGELMRMDTLGDSALESYDYDSFGDLTREYVASSTGLPSGTGASYSYDSLGQQTGLTYLPPAMQYASLPTFTAGYGYDAAGNMTAISDFEGDTSEITHDADGLATSMSLGGTTDSIATTYDDADVPATIDLDGAPSSPSIGFAYKDTASGETYEESDSLSSGTSSSEYSYDAESRLATVRPSSGPSSNYNYDASDNLQTLPGGSAACFGAAAEIVQSAPVNCNDTTGQVDYTYDSVGELVSTAMFQPSSLLPIPRSSTSNAELAYNGASELTSDNVADATGATDTDYSYDGSGLRFSMCPASGAEGPCRSAPDYFDWDTSGSAPELLADNDHLYLYDGGTAPFEQVALSDGAVSYLVSDRLGSVRAVLDASGKVVASTSYDTWGGPAGGTSVVGFPEAPSALSRYTPFGFAGGYTDADGLVYLDARYYDPSLGRFLTVDPAVNHTGQPYAYAGDDPVNLVDPTGQLSWDEFDPFSPSFFAAQHPTWGLAAIGITLSAVSFGLGGLAAGAGAEAAGAGVEAAEAAGALGSAGAAGVAGGAGAADSAEVAAEDAALGAGEAAAGETGSEEASGYLQQFASWVGDRTLGGLAQASKAVGERLGLSTAERAASFGSLGRFFSYLAEAVSPVQLAASCAASTASGCAVAFALTVAGDASSGLDLDGLAAVANGAAGTGLQILGSYNLFPASSSPRLPSTSPLAASVVTPAPALPALPAAPG